MVCAKHQQRANYRWLNRHKRLHAQHGPIDLIIEIDGSQAECTQAFDQAVAFFDTVLVDLVSELDQLRLSAPESVNSTVNGVVAQHMQRSVRPYQQDFITPMAAVAGSVADCTLAALCCNRDLDRAFVNNGGDIALHISAGGAYTIGICENSLTGECNANVHIDHLSPVRGVATSGWQGRSHSLGIADAVTVLASNSAAADAAATLIANRVDLPGSQKVQREAAKELSAESDLGDRVVTIGVATLSQEEKQTALSSGQQYAQTLVAQGLIDSAFMSLQGERIVAGQYPKIKWNKTA